MATNINKRAIVIVLDSFGIGSTTDSTKFGDFGANTLGHIDKYCFDHGLDFNIPNLLSMGLGEAYKNVNHHKLNCEKISGDKHLHPNSYYGACSELSSGKDTTSGHWEIAGCPVLFDWGYFTKNTNTFPLELLNSIVAKSGIKGYLGNCHASGTDIIRDLGDKHIETGFPIFYTSADSVFQIACHEKHFGLDNLYRLCQIVREELAEYNVARVIARPFIGDSAEGYTRTGNRKDYSLLPTNKTLLDICKDNGGEVVAIGKIGDIYAHQGTTVEIKANGIADLCGKTIDAIHNFQQNQTFIMTNLVDFDMLYGHRRDVVGYKNALEYLDTRLPEILYSLTNGDMLILTADHGCDPTWQGSDHTREHIPFLMHVKTPMKDVYSTNDKLNLGVRETFADIGQTIAMHLELPNLPYGTSCI